MQQYKVVGVGFQVGPGALMQLTKAQAKDRAHVIEDPVTDGETVLARAKVLQAFKPGETIGLEGVGKGQLGMVELVGGAKDEQPSLLSPQPKPTATDKKPAAKR